MCLSPILFIIPTQTIIRMITIVGPTACGKTTLAVALASRLDTEIISGDSRQVYRGMDIGTGKDISEYTVNGRTIPHHLIDIVPAGVKYTVYDFQHDFLPVYQDIISTRQRTRFLRRFWIICRIYTSKLPPL